MKLYVRKLAFVTLLIFNVNLSVRGQSPKIIHDAIIGSLSVNSSENVFDGDLSSGWTANDANGGWVGLDLGEKYVISEISYCPVEGKGEDMLLGIFEGANKPDFGDAIPLYIIKEKPEEGQLAKKSVICSRGFRYVRYVGPADSYCNLAELEFYGDKGEGDDSQLMQLTNLPTIVIHTVDAEDIVIKEKYIKGIVSVISEDGSAIYTDSLEIRGRGNSSWSFPKKPYRMKLKNKVSLLGAPAIERNWTLINNYGDKTLMRNLIAFDLSKKLGLAYTPFGTPVDVILNGEYKGAYQLCDQIEVASGRIEIEKMKENDISQPNLGGGYLLEIDGYADQEDSWFRSDNGIPVTIKYPKDDEIVEEQANYIKDFFNEMEGVLYSDNYKDNVDGYRRYIDVNSFMRLFFIGEFSGNTDALWSVYLYKKRVEDFFRFGPVWDFDIAFENDYRVYPASSYSDWVYLIDGVGNPAGEMRAFVNRLFSDESFVADMETMYANYRDKGVITEGSLLHVVDEYAELINQSQRLNFMRWDILNTHVHVNAGVWGSYEGEIDNLKTYIKDRLNWMDEKLNYSHLPVTSIISFSDNQRTVFAKGENQTIYLRNMEDKKQVEVVDMMGRKVFSGTLNEQLTISSGSGMFMIHISGANTEDYSVIKCLVK